MRVKLLRVFFISLMRKTPNPSGNSIARCYQITQMSFELRVKYPIRTV